MERASAASLGGVGLSGCAFDDRGMLWAIPERRRTLLAIGRNHGALSVMEVALDGVPEELDTESLAWLGSDRFAIGTERRLANRGVDAVLLAKLEGGRARVTGALELDWRALFAITVPSNQGVEGLCRAGSHLVAGGEPVIEREGRRFAPIARRKLDSDGSWTSFLLELTSATGKLSALDCWHAESDRLYVVGVERHYGTTRIIHFALPKSSEGSRVSAHVLANLDHRFHEMPNVEGIAKSGRQLVLLTDHDSARVAGSTEGIWIGPFDTEDELEAAESDD